MHRPDHLRRVSTAFEDPASARLGQFFGPAAEKHPGLSGFSLLSHGREAFIVRLALADLAERSLDMQYYSWDGDTTGRIIVDRVMKAADRGVRVRLLASVKAALDAHPNVEIRLFNPLTNRRWSTFDFIFDFGRVNRRMHNKLLVVDNAAAIVGGRNIGDIYYGVNTIANFAIWTCWRLALSSAICRRYSTDTGTAPRLCRSRPSSIAPMVAPISMPFLFVCMRRSPRPTTLILLTRTWRSSRTKAPSFVDNLVWAHGRVIADDPETIASGKESDEWSHSSAGESPS